MKSSFNVWSDRSERERNVKWRNPWERGGSWLEKGGGHLSRSIDQECFVNNGKQKIFRISIIAEMGKCLLIGKVHVTIANVMNIDTWYKVCTPPLIQKLQCYLFISMCVKTTKAEKFLTIVTILTKFYLKLNIFS